MDAPGATSESSTSESSAPQRPGAAGRAPAGPKSATRTSDGPPTAPTPTTRAGAAGATRPATAPDEPRPGIRVGSTPSGGSPSGATGTTRPSTPSPSAPAPVSTPASTAARTGSGAAPARPTGRSGTRRARLLVTRLDPWSVMKTFFVLSLAVAIVLVVAVALLWWTLDFTGVFAAIDRTISDVVGTGTVPFDIQSVLSFSRVMGATLVVCAVEIVLVSAMATLFAFLYNLSVGFTRGLEVTLSEDQ